MSKKRDNHCGAQRYNYPTELTRRETNCSFRDVYDSDGVRSSMILEVWGCQIDTLRFQIFSDLDSPEAGRLFSSFETVEGHSAFTSSLVQCFDQLWFLDGATVPMILRPQENDYIIISTAMVIWNDIGEDLESHFQQMTYLVEKGQIRRQHISIV
jgi:hypothetical protein